MSTNVSKEKRQLTIDKIYKIKDFLQNTPDENAQKLIAFLGDLENDLQTKKFGLLFEEHREEIDNLLDNSVPILKEDKKLEIANGGEQHFLIEGDNLPSLKLLEKTHREKIDLIYIDPPYNRGKKDFIYDDDYVDKVDTFKHSKWLSFMEKRLKIAKKLLKDSAAIFISIDWNEQASLKMLCDSVFGENNFISCISCSSNPGGDKGDFIETTLQYLLVYAKNKSHLKDLGLWEEQNPKNYKFEDEFGKYKKGGQLEKWGNDDTTHTHPNLAYSIYFNPNTNDVKHLFDYNQEEINENRELNIQYEKPSEELTNAGYFCIRPRITNAGENGRWRMEPDTFYQRLKHNDFIFENIGDGYKIYEKDRFEKFKFKKSKDFIPPEIAQQNSSDLLNIFGKKVFDYPKPLPLIEYVINCALSKTYNPNINIENNLEYTILDFFAGSGTTGHAVLKLNAKDNIKRKMILCTNNENNIARDVTYERLKTVITGKRKDGSKYSDGYKASLKYLKVDFVNITDKLYYEYADELLEHIKELVELENAINFDEDKSIAICLTEYEVDEFTETINEKTELKKIYLGHDIQLTDKQETLFENLGVEVIQIPEYYYDED